MGDRVDWLYLFVISIAQVVSNKEQGGVEEHTEKVSSAERQSIATCFSTACIHVGK